MTDNEHDQEPRQGPALPTLRELREAVIRELDPAESIAWRHRDLGDDR